MADKNSSAPRLNAALSILLACSLVFLLLRIICKVQHGKKTVLDDYILAVAWITFAVFTALMIASTKWGMGQHFEDLNLVDYVYATKLFIFAEIFAVISIAIAKTSFCVTLLRLANSKWQTILIWGIIITVNLFIWLGAIFVLASCSPVAKTWDPSIPGTCWDFIQFYSFGIFIGVYSAFTDFLLALFPWVLIWHLRMRRVEKAGIGIAMSMGVLSGVMAIVKTFHMIRSLTWTDFSYQIADVMIWSAAETATIIVAASIPFLRVVLKKLSLRGSNGQEQQSSINYDNIKLSTYRSRSDAADVAEAPRNRTPVDDRSDKNILGKATENAKNNSVTYTPEVMIEPQANDDVESLRRFVSGDAERYP